MTWLRRAAPLMLLFFFIAPEVHAANLLLFSPDISIVPTECRACPCGTGGALQLVQNLMNAAISLGVVIFILVLVYVGVLFLGAPTNPEAKSKARGVLANAVIGLLITLAGWLVVDYLMKLIYDSSAAKFGPWNDVLQLSGDVCIFPVQLSPIAGLPGLASTTVNTVILGTGSGGGGGSSSVGVAKGLCDSRNTACSPAVMKAEGLTDAQANAMSCIAVTESSGGANKGNSGTGAVGLFQITGQNWSNPANHKPPCSVSSSRLDNTCNRQAAVLMFKNGGNSYQPWTGKCTSQKGCGYVSYGQYWNPNAVACVQKYDPSGKL